MEASCRDLGLMDYKTCWELQQGLFDALVARKAACKGATKQVAAPLAANAGTAEASKASAREPAQRSAEAMPSKAGTQSGKGLESPTAGVPPEKAPPAQARSFWWNTRRYTHSAKAAMPKTC